MNAFTGKAALHELRRSVGIERSAEILVPMLQQFDLLALMVHARATRWMGRAG